VANPVGYYSANKEHCKKIHALWRAKNKNKIQQWNAKYNYGIKDKVLAFYGPSGKMKCCWIGCKVCDKDMLSLDHIDNTGSADRKIRGTGVNLYRKLIREGFPKGFQTLCHNHQWKKELMFRRNEDYSTFLT
jgi:hypothetical protein